MKEKAPIMAIAAVGGLVVVAMFFMQLIMLRKVGNINQPAATEVLGEAEEFGPTVPFGEPMLVNLSGGGVLRAKLEVELNVRRDKKTGEFDKEELEELKTEMEARLPKLRDKALTILRGMTLEEVKDPKSTEKIKRQLKVQFDKVVGKNKINSVYFTDFITE